MFVFLLVFQYFAVPAALQHTVLVWGIVGALVMRAALIIVAGSSWSRVHRHRGLGLTGTAQPANGRATNFR
jgi:hypothetical protein